MKLENKVALVTGSSQGLGRAIATRFAHEGADVVINYIGSPEHAEEVLTEVKAAGARGYSIRADVGKVDEVRGMVDEAVRHFGRVDILVNNAGVERNRPFWEVSEEDYDLV